MAFFSINSLDELCSTRIFFSCNCWFCNLIVNKTRVVSQKKKKKKNLRTLQNVFFRHRKSYFLSPMTFGDKICFLATKPILSRIPRSQMKIFVTKFCHQIKIHFVVVGLCVFISNYVISLCFCYSLLCVCPFSKIKFLLCFLVHIHFSFINSSIKDTKRDEVWT